MMNIPRLISWCEVQAEAAERIATRVSGEGEAAEIYRDIAKALKELDARHASEAEDRGG